MHSNALPRFLVEIAHFNIEGQFWSPRGLFFVDIAQKQGVGKGNQRTPAMFILMSIDVASVRTWVAGQQSKLHASKR